MTKARLYAVGHWLYRRAENVIALMLAVMFIAFMVQIVFRYALGLPSGWAFELSLMMWVWLVPWGAAFVVTEREMIRFDLLYDKLGRRLRLVTSIITGLFIIVVYLYSLPAVLDYVLFMKVQKTAYLDVRFDILYAIYPIFAVAVVFRYIWIVANALRGKAPERFDPTQASSGI
ncbi:MAG TPA: TRAP transporter small permease subunit [Devosia sp.]|nr:TRAP transporter small permease subunit [Devosia sp.]